VGHSLRSAPRTAAAPQLGYVTDDRTLYGDAADDIAAFARPARVIG
jgi:hypothetical protein